MRLSKIELFGFKSFADKTVLSFQNGITAIVGPNGCGKSNISDAFRWVLGEQSAKSLRGSKMMDVIFAGTERRKPLNFAEVTLTFNDIDKVASFTEVAVTRRLHRSGESEYFINKKKARLKDVYDFFLDSGVGKDAFAIFEQGKIDQIISSAPLERRYIFEDAAGILRFLIRKKEALRKLEQMELNLSRVKDIHSEVEKQIEVLEEQATKAKEYKEKKSQFEELEKAILSTKWHQNFQRLEEIENASEGLECSKHVKELEQQTESLKKSKEGVAQKRQELEGKTQSINDFKREAALIQQQTKSNQTRLQEIKENEKKWLQEGAELAKQTQNRKIEKEQLVVEEEKLRAEATELEGKAKEQRELVKTLSSEVSSMRHSQTAFEKERYQLLQKEKGLENEFKQWTFRLEHALEKKNQLHSNKKELQASGEEGLKKIEEQIEHSRLLEQELEAAKQETVENEKSIHSITEALQEKQRLLHQKQKEIAEHQARKNVLSRLKEENQGFSPASKRLLQEAGTKTSPLYKKVVPLYECIEKADISSMAAVMRSYTYTLVVETKVDLEEVLSFAVEKELKDFSLICRESVQEELTDHFFKKITVSDRLESARRLSLQTIWKEQGIFVDGNGVLFYQSVGENQVFLREAELKKLEKWLVKAKGEVTQLEEQLNLLKEQQKNELQKKKQIEEQVRKKEMAVAELNFALKRLKSDQESKQKQLEKIEEEGKNLEQTLQELETKLEESQQKLIEIQEKTQITSDDYEKAKETLKLKTEHLEAEEKKQQELSRQERDALDRLRKIEQTLQVLEIKEQDGEKRKGLLEEEIKKGEEKRKQIEEQDQTLKEQEATFQEQLKSLEESYLEQQELVRENEKAITSQESAIEEKRHQLKAQEELGYQLGIQKAQVESQLSTLSTELLERYQLEAEETKILLEIPVEKAERKCKKLRSEVGDPDQINMRAIEECEQHKVRFSFLQEQMGDLEEAKQELVHIITDLDGQSRKVFKETFETIKENFKKNFTILFQGGEADLQFTDAADVLEAGIEIVAKPPGKKMQSIQLMSGGEKCLTAMALLFAIFEVKPAPFCILDEIDAPLDDSNVERFMRLVKQYEEQCQFLIVTHNKETMTSADVLFGVSMQEKGVSRVLGVEFAEEGSVEELSSSHSG